jgi:hypothetical protein
VIKKERSLWSNLGLALLATPAVAIVGLIIITIIGALDVAITKLQSAGLWWLLIIFAYVISLFYFLFSSKIRLWWNQLKNK